MAAAVTTGGVDESEDSGLEFLFPAPFLSGEWLRIPPTSRLEKGFPEVRSDGATRSLCVRFSRDIRALWPLPTILPLPARFGWCRSEAPSSPTLSSSAAAPVVEDVPPDPRRGAGASRSGVEDRSRLEAARLVISSMTSTKSNHWRPQRRGICSSWNSDAVMLARHSSRPPGLSPFGFFSRSNWREGERI